MPSSPPRDSKGSEEVTEYRVCGENRDGKWEGRPGRSLPLTERLAGRMEASGPRPNKNVRIESRTVTYSPWEVASDAE